MYVRAHKARGPCCNCVMQVISSRASTALDSGSLGFDSTRKILTWFFFFYGAFRIFWLWRDVVLQLSRNDFGFTFNVKVGSGIFVFHIFIFFGFRSSFFVSFSVCFEF